MAMVRAALCPASAESLGAATVHPDPQPSECGQSPPEGIDMLLSDSNRMLRVHGEPGRSRRRRAGLSVRGLGVPALLLPVVAAAQSSPFLTGATALQNNILAWLTPIAVIVENCGTTLILRCSCSEQGGTSQFASRLIGEREVIRRQTSHGRDRDGWFSARGARRSTQVNEQQVVESAVLAAELEQLPDLGGYLKTASCRSWRRVTLSRTEKG
jgi:Type IV secretion-system coupling protein DNA-binding domain